jgi:hypothetical protein
MKLSMDLKELSALFGQQVPPSLCFQPISLIQNLDVRKMWESYFGATCNFVSTENFVLMLLRMSPSDMTNGNHYDSDETKVAAVEEKEEDEKQIVNVDELLTLLECFFAGSLVSPFRCDILTKAFGSNLETIGAIFSTCMNNGIKHTLWMPRKYCEKSLRTQKDYNDQHNVIKQFPYMIRFSESNIGKVVLSHCNDIHCNSAKHPILHRLAGSHHTIMAMVDAHFLEKSCYSYVSLEMLPSY